jgi:predicted metal-dependent hydrolase
MKHTFVYGAYAYTYSVEFSARKTLGLEVRPDLSISVRAPLDTQQSDIEAFLTRKWLWLEKNMAAFRKYAKTSRDKQYVSGEAFYYLGRQYMLYVERDSLDMVKLERGKLHVYTTRSVQQNDYTKVLVENWFARQRRRIFAQEYRRAGQKFERQTLPELRERAMTRRWSSHTADSVIYLNPRLIQAPRQAIYYVCIHELCHVNNKRHDQDFYRTLEAHIPKWQTIKHALEVNFG